MKHITFIVFLFCLTASGQKSIIIKGGNGSGSSGVTSFNGRTGEIVPASGDYSFSQLSGIPTTLSGYGITDGLSTSRTITINGTTYDLSANRSWTVGDLSSSGSYSNPAWLTGLAWSKLSSVPANVSSFGSLANSSGWLKNNGSGTLSYSTPSKSDVGLGNLNNPSNSVTFTTSGTTSITVPTSGTMARTEDLVSITESSPQIGDVLYKSGTGSYINKAGAFTRNDIKLLQGLGSSIIATTFNNMSDPATSGSITSGQGYIMACWLGKPDSATGLGIDIVTTGSFTATASNNLALYSYSSGTWTLVDSCTNSSTIFTTSGANKYAFKNGKHYLNDGVYGVAFTYNSSAQTTAPGVGNSSANDNTYATLDFTNSVKLMSTFSATAIPTTIATTSTSATTRRYRLFIYK